MSNKISIGQLIGTTSPIGVRPVKTNVQAQSCSQAKFQELLDEKVLKFSHHAQLRMQQRGIVLQPEQMEKIAGAIDQAEARGAKDSLILLRDIAMIVNVPSRTVVTAMDGQGIKGNVYTQIDSAVVIS
ncbi:TIGR02530 family flagellar biosynthesis protein [Paenibacillus pinihumi]|uniref:TIGR02530 family flagellar biosynthesis protein n=1 Tax=Paenibacillus pinihumi TaxID=669462 RepID=UPI0003F5C130|nr:TIGR02530 family flagellar biosynthesis protein [Paenibacillus pinihumi]